jgi:hypothetical protein
MRSCPQKHKDSGQTRAAKAQRLWTNSTRCPSRSRRCRHHRLLAARSPLLHFTWTIQGARSSLWRLPRWFDKMVAWSGILHPPGHHRPRNEARSGKPAWAAPDNKTSVLSQFSAPSIEPELEVTSYPINVMMLPAHHDHPLSRSDWLPRALNPLDNHSSVNPLNTGLLLILINFANHDYDVIHPFLSPQPPPR